MNRRVLVTRPAEQGALLCDEIAAQGGFAIHFPTIAFAPLVNQEDFLRPIAELGQQDWVIFISPQAVYSSVTAIHAAWPHFPKQVKLAAVGRGTAKVVQTVGLGPNVVYPADDQEGSVGLLELAPFQTVANQKIAIIRGEGGREYLEQTLLARGADVMHVIAYRRILPQVDVHYYVKLLEQRDIDIIVCTSFEGVRNLKVLMGEAGWPYLKVIPLVVVSERIKRLTQDLGFQTIEVAVNASNEGLLEMISTITK